jgi:hypothetical protein
MRKLRTPEARFADLPDCPLVEEIDEVARASRA